MVSMGVQASVHAAFLFMAWFWLLSQEWYVPFDPDLTLVDWNTKQYRCQENSTVFFMIMWQIPSVLIIFNRNRPFRKNLWTNWQFVAYLSFVFVMQASLQAVDVTSLDSVPLVRAFVVDFIGLVELPASFRLQLALMSFVDVALAALLEVLTIGRIRYKETKTQFTNSVITRTPYPEHPSMRVTLITGGLPEHEHTANSAGDYFHGAHGTHRRGIQAPTPDDEARQ